MKTKTTTKLLRDGCSKETCFNDQLALKDFPAAAFSCSTHLRSLVSCATCPTVSTRWRLQSAFSYIFVFPVDPPCCSRQKHLSPHLCHHCAATAQDEWSSLGWRPLSPDVSHPGHAGAAWQRSLNAAAHTELEWAIIYPALSYFSSPTRIKSVRLAFSAWVCQAELELHTHLSSSHQCESSFIASRVVNPPLGLHQHGSFFLRIIRLSNGILERTERFL